MRNSTGILVPQQVKLLQKCEAVIERGLKTFIEVGTALKQIKDEKLYLRDYETFDDYCRERRGFKHTYAHRLIKSAEVVEHLLPIGNTLPATESQARPLAQLPVEQQANAWANIVDECKERGEVITAAAVVDVVER